MIKEQLAFNQGVYKKMLLAQVLKRLMKNSQKSIGFRVKEEFGTIFTYITLILLLVVVPALLVKIMFTDQSSLLCEK